MPGRPGGTQARRPLHFFWALDTSASMQGEKIDALNNAVRAALPAMVDTAAENPFAEMLVRALAFGQGVRWHIATPTPVEAVTWTDLDTNGRTDMGLALREIAAQLSPQLISGRSFPPVIVLVSDGKPTDDFAGGLAELMATLWGAKAVRVAIAIGGGADVPTLERFVANPEIPVLTAGNPDELVHYLRWVSTAAQTASIQVPVARDGLTVPLGQAFQGVPIPAPPPLDRGGQFNQQVTW
jgi:uncharacterized protein YegL